MNVLHFLSAQTSAKTQKFLLMVGALLLSFFLSTAALASGITYVKTGEEFSAALENTPKKAKTEWVLSQKGEIVERKQSKKFTHTFAKEGEFSLRAITKDPNNIQETTLFQILAVDNLPNFQALEAHVKTLPLIKNNAIALSAKAGETADVLFDFGPSTGDIVKYEIDTDIFSDGDGDGEIGNDIDNKSHASYLTGGTFSHSYKNTGLPARARLRVTDKKGETKETFIIINFPENSAEQEARKNAEISAEMTTLPETQDDGNIWILGEKGTVMVFSGYSSGDIQEFRIDTDTTVDSNNDGIDDNDIDNKGSDSFSTGATFAFDVQKKLSGDPQVVQLTIIDKEGKKSIQRKKILFKNNSLTGNSGIIYLRPVLFASRSTILEGETATFEVFSAPENAKYSWDFDGDGVLEIENGSEKKVEYKFSDAGKFPVSVQILESGKDTIEEIREISVQENFRAEIETHAPVAKFSSDISGNKVSFFSSESSADENMINTDLSYSWDFGDELKTEGSNPVHVYEKPGKYTITLEVEDALERTVRIEKEVEISEITEEFSADQHGTQATENPENPEEVINVTDDDLTEDTEGNDDANENKNPENSSSFPWWIIALIVLFLLFLLALLPLLKRKIENPDKDFGDIFAEIFGGKKSKTQKNSEISGNIENGEKTEENKEIETLEKEEHEEVENVFSGNVLGESEDSGEIFGDSQVNTPDWMKGASDEEITAETPALPAPEPEHTTETEISEKSSVVNEEQNLSSSNSEENIPDWLKGADSPFSDDLDDDITENNKNTENSENTEISKETILEKNEEISEKKSEETSIFNAENSEETPAQTEETPSTEEKIEEVKTEENIFSDFSHPDWLEDIKDDGEENNSHDPLNIPEISATETQELSENSEEDDLPDWLKDDETQSPSTEILPPVSSPLAPEKSGEISEEIKSEDEAPKKKKKRRRRKKKKKVAVEEIEESETAETDGEIQEALPSKDSEKNNFPENSEEDDLPDWLKDDESQSPSTEISTPASSPLAPEKSAEISEEIKSEDATKTESILAKDAKLPRKEDSSEIPEWLK